MKTDFKPEIRQELDTIVEVIVDTVNVVEVYLFGSFARGEETEDSDFDIFVVLDDSEERTLLCRQRINFALCEMNTRNLDVLASHWSKYSNETTRGTMGKVVFSEGVKLYEQGKYPA